MAQFPRFIVLLSVALTAGAALGETPKVDRYPFVVPPLEISGRFGKLKIASGESIPTADANVLSAFWQTRTGKSAKAAAQADDAAVMLHLLAAGVSEKVRAEYLKKFVDLVAAAEKAVAEAKTDREKADRLLRFLHKSVMAKGYKEQQTTLSGVFDTGTYNCVSSSALFFLVGTRLELKLQPVLIPGALWSVGHAAVDLVDGKTRVQIEPTNPDGYDWPTKLKRPGVFVIGPQPDRNKAYDADGFGLAGAAASNRGNEAGKAKPPRTADAVRLHAIALTLDPKDPTAANNMIAAVSNCGLEAKGAGNFEDALTVYACAREVLGNKRDLEHNYYVVWEHYLSRIFEDGKFEDGLKLVPRAHAAFPMDAKLGNPSEWVRRAANVKCKKDGWAAGLAFADSAIKNLTGDASKSVLAWKSSSRRQWSQELLKGGDAGGSLKVLADGLKETPNNKDLLGGVTYHIQEALGALDKKGGPEAAVAHFKEVCEEFPKEKGVREAGHNHAVRATNKLASAKDYSQAMKAAEAYAPLAGDRAGELTCLVFDAWGRALADDGKWEDAMGKYAEGLKAFPKDGRLANNSIAAVDRWAAKPMRNKDWKEAIRIYDVGLKYFPDSKHLKHNRDYCTKQEK